MTTWIWPQAEAIEHALPHASESLSLAILINLEILVKYQHGSTMLMLSEQFKNTLYLCRLQKNKSGSTEPSLD